MKAQVRSLFSKHGSRKASKHECVLPALYFPAYAHRIAARVPRAALGDRC